LKAFAAAVEHRAATKVTRYGLVCKLFNQDKLSQEVRFAQKDTSKKEMEEVAR
jgi:hypothetical protein